jgi:hypothetical protein
VQAQPKPPHQQQQQQQYPEQQYRQHPYAAQPQNPPPRQQPPAPAPGPVPDRGTVKLAPHTEKDTRGAPPPAASQAYANANIDPNDPHRTVHVWNSVRKVPKEMEQHHQQQLPPPTQSQSESDDPVPDVEGNAMLEGVILPAFDNVSSIPTLMYGYSKVECMLTGRRSDRGSLTLKLGGYWSDVGMRLSRRRG